MDTNQISSEIVSEVAKELLKVVRRAYSCRSIAEQLKRTVDGLLPIVQEIRYSGVELPQTRQSQLSELANQLNLALDLARKASASPRWNVYRSVQLAKKMEKVDRWIAKWIQRQMPAHALADVHQLRVESDQRIAKIERKIEELAGLSPMAGCPVAVGSVVGEQKGVLGIDVMMMDHKLGVIGGTKEEELVVLVGAGARVGKERVKKMLMRELGDKWGVVGISGLGGSGKTTLAREICRDLEIRAFFKDRIFFETVSQSPNLETLKLNLWEKVTGYTVMGTYNQIPEWQLHLVQREKVPVLVVLDDIWDSSQIEDLTLRIPGCVILVVSRSKFPSLILDTYEMELLEEEAALSLFCQVAFEQDSIPATADKKLVKQVVAECKGLPLALKVVGASMWGQSSPKMWAGARNRLTRAESISVPHETRLLERMAASVDCLSGKVKECFLDLASFPEDKNIPLAVLMNLWMEIHDLDEEDAYAVLVELSNKNLLTLVKDAQNKAGDLYSSYSELSVTQHDVLRDLAIHMGNREPVNSRRRLVMPRREDMLPRDWERNNHQKFDAQIVSIHTGEMKESDWYEMCFPKAEVLILNFSSSTYFLPPFITTMQNLKTLVLTNYGTTCATLKNLTAFTSLNSLRNLWLEKISLPPLPKTTIPLKSLRKISLVQCELNNSLKGSKMDLSMTFPRLSDLTLDHCIDLKEIPSSICEVTSLTSITISNCHDLTELPYELGKLGSLEILRVYACPALRLLPRSICRLKRLKYLDISQCITMRDLPEELGHLISLEKIDMRECSQLKSIPRSYSSLKSLGHVVCDEELASLWKEAEREIPDLRVQVAEECYNLDWIVE
ncbi:Disease resistance protein ADR1 [Rhynchospora pubera]|uniref:Disease resistance protein ADR1 n=1 Tax=Rhynchospora pubera TaxID=906938 RepID=A0AAV8ESZ6_9POAL|nr:Disease resistance protein ADR1 [Rhynchospora pubera]